MISFINCWTIPFLKPVHKTDTLINVGGTTIISGIAVKCLTSLVALEFYLRGALGQGIIKLLESKISHLTKEKLLQNTAGWQALGSTINTFGNKVALGIIVLGVAALAIALIAKLILRITPPSSLETQQTSFTEDRRVFRVMGG